MRPFKATQSNIIICFRVLHFVPILSLWTSFLLKGTYFVPSAHFLFPCTFFVHLHSFCFILNLFHPCFHANPNKKNNTSNNNKASFRTFERCSMSKITKRHPLLTKYSSVNFVTTDVVKNSSTVDITIVHIQSYLDLSCVASSSSLECKEENYSHSWG